MCIQEMSFGTQLPIQYFNQSNLNEQCYTKSLSMQCLYVGVSPIARNEWKERESENTLSGF